MPAGCGASHTGNIGLCDIIKNVPGMAHHAGRMKGTQADVVPRMIQRDITSTGGHLRQSVDDGIDFSQI